MASSNVQAQHQQAAAWGSAVNIAPSFVPTKLWFDKKTSNYVAWKEQMLCLIESQGLLGFIDGTNKPPPPETGGNGTTSQDIDETGGDGTTSEDIENPDYVQWRRSDVLLKGWILCSLNDDVVSTVTLGLETSRDVWVELENKFQRISDVDPPQYGPGIVCFGFRMSLMGLSLKRRLVRERMSWGLLKLLVCNRCGTLVYIIAPKTRETWVEAHGLFPTDGAIDVTCDLIGALLREILSVLVSYEPQRQSTFSYYAEPAEQGDLKEYLPLHRAALRGNWAAAKHILDRNPSGLTKSINVYSSTALHIAVGTGKAIHFVEKMVAAMPPESLAATDDIGNTALSIAAAVGNIAAATILVSKKPDLLYIPNKYDEFPVQVAALYARKEMLQYLSSVTRDDFGENPYAELPGLSLLQFVIEADYFGAPVDKTLSRQLANDCDMESMAQNSQAAEFQSLHAMLWKFVEQLGVIKSIKEKSLLKRQALQLVKRLCKEIELLSFDEAKDIYFDAIMLAAELGINEVVEEIVDTFPSAFYFKWLLLATAQEVEKFVSPDSRESTNKDEKTPKMVFTEQHKMLKEEGEKWMKDTANSCMIAAALIVTVMFAAAITVPGGNNSTSGFPIFSGNSAFIVFAISDAVSLFTSATSLLMFLAILTSRYAEEDFLYVLPKRLIVGLGTLFLSISSMMVAFSATLYLVFGRKEAWVLIPVGALARFPITSFALLQFPLLVELIYSTYGPGIFKQQSNRPFY
ncbi:UNVERIFIED_CONTAM: hypothetical protein Sangu_1526500 [Sesamum angustifolium]|uniref:PGG domain-containing protein n=1 Tax=Sesamum angustifolium TaxID=2727405 RepID=A0AAW2MSI9_9LAMI